LIFINLYQDYEVDAEVRKYMFICLWIFFHRIIGNCEKYCESEFYIR